MGSFRKVLLPSLDRLEGHGHAQDGTDRHRGRAVGRVGGARRCLAQAQQAPACANPRAIGVSRVIEVDATGGPRFGLQLDRGSLLNDGEVILTFDDGPLQPYTQQVLAALADHCTKATFFMVGRRRDGRSGAGPGSSPPGAYHRHAHLVGAAT